MAEKPHSADVQSGRRFEFGKNWEGFLSVLDEERILEAEESLKRMLDVENLEGKRFVDVGSGSGLFSLAARRLGAHVVSFDYDPASVRCTTHLRERFFNHDTSWVVHEGSVLDEEFLGSLGTFDIVYSWGVLHHTGAMWDALANVVSLVQDGGRLFIAIYNDQGRKSVGWRRVKQVYCANEAGRILILAWYFPLFIAKGFVLDLMQRKNPLRRYREYRSNRGMSIFHDWIDWLGGYPFEVARPDQVFSFYRERGFELQRLVTMGGGLGCNQYVFVRPGCSDAAPAVAGTRSEV